MNFVCNCKRCNNVDYPEEKEKDEKAHDLFVDQEIDRINDEKLERDFYREKERESEKNTLN